MPSGIRHNNSLLVGTAANINCLQPYHVRDVRCPYCILGPGVQAATNQLLEPQSIELIDSAKRRRLRRCSKLCCSKKQWQHSVQEHTLRNVRWHETSAETPNKCLLRDGIRTVSEVDGSVNQLQDTETGGVACIITVLTGVSITKISQT